MRAWGFEWFKGFDGLDDFSIPKRRIYIGGVGTVGEGGVSRLPLKGLFIANLCIVV